MRAADISPAASSGAQESNPPAYWMHEPVATYRTIGPFSSTAYGDGGGVGPGFLPCAPAIRRVVPAKMVEVGTVHHAAFGLSSATNGVGLRGWLPSD